MCRLTPTSPTHASPRSPAACYEQRDDRGFEPCNAAFPLTPTGLRLVLRSAIEWILWANRYDAGSARSRRRRIQIHRRRGLWNPRIVFTFLLAVLVATVGAHAARLLRSRPPAATKLRMPATGFYFPVCAILSLSWPQSLGIAES